MARYRRIAVILLGLFATGLTRDLASGPASATFGLRNVSGVSIAHIYTVPADEDEAWSSDLLAGTMLLSGDSRLFPQTSCEEFDVKLVDAANRECRFEGMYLCLMNPCDLPAAQGIEGADGTWELTAGQMKGCQDFGM